MKIFLIAVFVLTASASYGQASQYVELKWKIAKNEQLKYATVMNDIDTNAVNIDFGGLFNSLSDSTKVALNESKALFEKINETLKNQDYVTTLTNKGRGVVDITMSTKPKEQAFKTNKDAANKEEELLKIMSETNHGILLRGSVYETGSIHSFWVKNDQKNLISLLFELPSKPVKIGDKWSLNVNLIGNDQNFECDSAYKINEVILTDIRLLNGETIAVLKYNIAEYVKGTFNMPSFLKDTDAPTPTTMKFTHQGLAEFSIDRGRWITYNGIMSINATGVMTADKKTKFTLTDQQNIEHK